MSAQDLTKRMVLLKHYRKNIYRKRLCQFPKEKTRLFGYAHQLATQVPLFRVSRNKELHNASVFHEFIYNTFFI